MTASCADCGESFNPTLKGSWVQVVGWVVERSGGGANAVREKRPTGLHLCPPCGKMRDLGLDRNQGRLL